MKNFNLYFWVSTIFVLFSFNSIISDDCFSTALGYPCCSEFASIEYTDEDGNWGIENDQWCGIIKKCYYSVGDSNPNDVINSYFIKLLFSEDMSSVSMFDPESRVYIKPLEEKVQYFLEQYKKVCDNPSEPYYDKFGEIDLITSGENYILVSAYIPSYVAKRVELLPEVESVYKNKRRIFPTN
eukprot:jgi/Orpsp1_1/1191224/evm.model.d7180000084209.1